VQESPVEEAPVEEASIQEDPTPAPESAPVDRPPPPRRPCPTPTAPKFAMQVQPRSIRDSRATRAISTVTVTASAATSSADRDPEASRVKASLQSQRSCIEWIGESTNPVARIGRPTDLFIFTISEELQLLNSARYNPFRSTNSFASASAAFWNSRSSEAQARQIGAWLWEGSRSISKAI
jgi:hypothetical protein